MNIIFSRILFVLLLIGVPIASNAQQDCSVVLQRGAFKSQSVNSNNYVRQVLAAKLSSLSKSEAEKTVGAGANASIYGVPVGANYSDKQYQSWLNDVRQQLDIDDTNSRSDAILSSEGDQTIVNGWVACLTLQSSGVWVKLKPVGAADVELSITYFPGLGGPSEVVLTEDIQPSGAVIQSGASLAKKGSKLTAQNTVLIGLKRTPGESVYVAVNTSVKGGSGYLPKTVTLPPIPPEDSLTLNIPTLSFPYPLARNAQGALLLPPGGHRKTFGNACTYGKQPYERGIRQIMIINGNVGFIAPGDEVASTPSPACPATLGEWTKPAGFGAFYVTSVQPGQSRTMVYGFWALDDDIQR